MSNKGIYRSSAHIKRVNGLKPHRVESGVEEKHCNGCDTWKRLDEFYNHRSSWDGLYGYCKTCTKVKSRITRKKHYDTTKERRREYFDQYQASGRRKTVVNARYRCLKDQVIEGYGGRCAQCEFADRRALCIDHVNGGGALERARQLGKEQPATFLRRIIREDFPAQYQLLCANCNMIKMYENREHPGWNSYEMYVSQLTGT